MTFDGRVAGLSVLMSLGRHVGLATLAGIIAGGIVGGLGGRIAMRVTAFGVLLVGVALGVLGGLVYAVVEPWLRRFRPWHGLAFGIFLLVAAGISVLDPVNSDFGRFGSAPLNVAMFAALFVLFGGLIAWIFDRLPAMAPQVGTRARFVAGLAG